MNDKVLSLLGICRKAGKISLGHDECIASIKNRRAKLCLLCRDLSERAKEEFERAGQNLGGGKLKLIYTDYSMDDIQSAVGSRAGVLTINDVGFAKKILQLLGNMTGEE